MPMNNNIHLLQVRAIIGDDGHVEEMDIVADEDPGKNPVEAKFRASGVQGEKADLFQEVVAKLQSAYPSKSPISLCIGDDDEIKRDSEC